MSSALAATAQTDWGDWGEGTSAETARIETRDSFGGRLVHDAEILGDPDGATPITWDTTALADGWHDKTSGAQTVSFAVINSPTVTIQEGRLTANITWTSHTLHLLRNHVVVPNGVTLTIAGGTIVKFTEDTQIVVEDGGKLVIEDSAGNDVWFLQAEDDSIGGDTDMRDGLADWATVAVRKFPSGTVTENGYVAQNGNGVVTSGTFISLSLNNAQGVEQNGKAHIPVTLSGTRNARFSIDWVAEPGTATFGGDYTLASGTLEWTGTSQGTKYIEIPLVQDAVQEDAETFTVRIVATRGINANVTTATVTIVDSADGWAGDWGDGISVETARIETRDSFGGRLVHGMEILGDPDGAPPTAWDTTALADGWHDKTSGAQTVSVAVINSPTVTIQEGRLAANTTWTSDKLHLLRNHVVVPNGVTLTIAGGTIVKFTEDTQIVVEDGGKLVIEDSAGNDVWFLQAEDDSIGGDTDMRDGLADWTTQAVRKFPSGTVTENGYVAQNGNGVVTSGTFQSLALNDAQVMEQSGMAYVAVTLSGSTRNTRFSIDWVAEPGTATLGDDYTLASGTLEWTGTSQGTKYIEIPLVVDTDIEPPKDFSVRIVTSRGVNATQSTATVTLLDSIAELTTDQLWAEVVTSESVPVDTREDFVAKLAADSTPLTYSPNWVTPEADSVRITATPRNGSTATLFTSGDADEGVYAWNTASLAEGRYTLTHEFVGASGETLTTDLYVLRSAVQHGGRLVTDEVWTAEKVHLVVETVIVPAGVTLEIQPGTVVKFADGTGIIVETGGALNISSAILTHVADDTVGGDTNMDGSESSPVADSWNISGAGTITIDDATQERWHSPLATSGTLSSSQLWRGGKVYYVSDDIIVPNGVTLTILPGAVVKFAEGKRITVQTGGELNAIGTASDGIVFTSIKDDTFGGDTNGDGKASMPDPGDWIGIINNGGEINVTHAEFYYGGYGQYSNQGDAVLRNNSGTLTVRNCEFAASLLRHIYAAGTVYIENTILKDARWAVEGSAVLVNCVIYDCQNSLTGSGQIKNSIISNCTNSPSGGYSFKNCVLWQAGSAASCIVADPFFHDAENGDFTLRAGSPCIDAGDGSVAPERDYFGQERVDDLNVTDTGTPLANGAVPDIGIYEMTANAASEVDLKAASVSVPTSAQVGESIDISFGIANIGSAAAKGSCVTEVWFVSALTGAKVKVTDISATLDLAVGGEVVIARQITVPALADGDWRLRVIINATRSIFEGQSIANNTLDAFGVTQIGMSELTGVVDDFFVAANSERTFKVIADDDADTVLLINAAGGLVINGAYGYVPTSGASDFSATDCGDGLYVITIPAGSGSVYITVGNESLTGQTLAIEPTTDELRVFSASLSKIPNIGSATFTLTGTGFTANTTVQLRSGGTTLTPSTLRFISATQLAVTMSPQYATAGNYEVVVSNGSDTVTLPTTIEVTQEAVGGRLEMKLVMPDAVREGRVSVCYIEYSNTGDADALAPVFQLAASGCKIGASDAAEVSKTALQFIGAGDAANAGVLSPGATHRIPFLMLAGASNTVTLYSSNEKEFYGQPWTSTADYLAGLSAAATRLGLRGDDATNFKKVFALAEAMKKGDPTSAISGHVKDLQGNPVAGAVLTFTEETTSEQIAAMTDKTGFFSASIPAAGKYSVEISTVMVETDRTFVVNGSSDYNGAVFYADQRISFVITCPEGMAETAIVYATSTTFEGTFIPHWDAGNRAVFRGLSEGVYQVKARNGDKIATVHVYVDSDGDFDERELEFLVPGTIQGQVQNISVGNEIAVMFFDEKGQLDSASVNEDGTFEITSLLPGSYTVSLLGISDESCEILEDVTLFEGESKVIAFTGNLTALVSGRLMSFGATAGIATTNAANLSDSEVLSKAKALRQEAETLMFTKVPLCGECNCSCLQKEYRNVIAVVTQNYAKINTFAASEGMAWHSINAISNSGLTFVKASLAMMGGKLVTGISKVKAAFAIGSVGSGLGYIEDGAMDLVGNVEKETNVIENVEKNLDVGSASVALAGTTIDAGKAIAKDARKLKKKVGGAEKSLGVLGTVSEWMDIGGAAMKTGEAIANVEIASNRIQAARDALRRGLPAFENSIAAARQKLGTRSCTCMQCPDPAYEPQEDQFCPVVPQSCDPNEMSGPVGAGAERYVLPGQWLEFKVYFENMPDATGAAQEVHINNNLSGYLDWSTFELGEVAFGGQIELGLRGQKNGQIEVNQKGVNTKVRVATTFDAATGKAYWYLRSLDPTTADGWPLDAYSGFLPPNDPATGSGEGYVAYRVKVKADAPHNARIDSSADIVFDYNAPIVTDPAWFNTVYADGSTPATPVFTQTPGDTTAKFGATLKLTATASGFSSTSAPLTYQWQKDGVDIDGATSATLTIDSARPSHGGVYTVVVTNGFGSTTSESFTLTVQPDNFAITQQPQDIVAEPGDLVEFSVSATGHAPLRFQWRRNGESIEDADESTLEFVADMDDNGAVYTVIVTNESGSVTSRAAKLTVTLLSPGFDADGDLPAQTSVKNGNVTLSVSLTSDPPATLQWQKSTDGGKTWSNVSGQAASTLTLAGLSYADDGTQYRVRATNDGGKNYIYSTPTILVIDRGEPWAWEPHDIAGLTNKGVKLAPPKTLAVPKGTKLAKGTKAIYVWKDADGNVLNKRDKNGAYVSAKNYTTKVNGIFSVELRYTPLSDDKVTVLPEVVTAHEFGVVKLFDPLKIAKVNGFVAEAMLGNVQVLDKKGNPAANTVVEGEKLRFTVVLESGTGPLRYTWYRGKTVVKITEPTYALTDAFETPEYGAKPDAFSVVVETLARDAKGKKALTTAKSKAVKAKVILKPTVTITTPESKLTAMAGENITIAAKATGTAKLNYEWSGPDGKVLLDAKGNSFNKAAVALKKITTSQAGTYTIRVTNGAGEKYAATASVVVTVQETPVFTATAVVAAANVMAYSVPSEGVVKTGAATGARQLGTTLNLGGLLYLTDSLTKDITILYLADAIGFHYETMGEETGVVTFTQNGDVHLEYVTLTLSFEGADFGEYELKIDGTHEVQERPVSSHGTFEVK